MSKVTITFEPLKRYARISIDGDHISPYSDLAMCESKDLHVCGMRLFKLLDEEIASEYSVEIQAHPFQIALMHGLAQSSEFCTRVGGSDIPMRFSADEIYRFAMGMAERHHIELSTDGRVRIHGAAAAELAGGDVVIDETNPDFLVTTVSPNEDVRGKTILLLTEHYAIRNERGMNIVEIPAQRAKDFCAYYRIYAKMIPLIEAVFSQCRYHYHSLSQEEQLYLDAYTSQTPKYLFELAQTRMDVGGQYGFKLEAIPASAANTLTLRVSDPSVLCIENDHVRALSQGTAALELYDEQNRLCEAKQIEVTNHSYVTSIRLAPSSISLEVGKKGQIEAYVLPEDAEDAKRIKWHSSNPDVLHVTSSGEIVALKPGTVSVTASSTTCRAEVTIHVQPVLERITLSKTAISAEVGSAETVKCVLYPPEAAHGEIVWELSNDAMGSLAVSDDGKSCVFNATTSSLAKGTLKCRIKGSEKNATCTIEVVPENRPMGLITCSIVFSVIGMILSFLIPVVWFGGGGIGGFFADIFLPVGIVISLIGRSKTQKKEKIFSTMLTLDLIFSALMLFIAVTACNPRR